MPAAAALAPVAAGTHAPVVGHVGPALPTPHRDVGASPADDAPCRVLFVCGEPALQAPVVFRLALERFGVATAGSDAEALASVRRDAYHVVLLRVELPQLAELDTLRRLREAAAGHRPLVVVVLLTGPREWASEERGRVAALAGGADDVVPWSDSLDELMLRLRALRRRTAAPLLADADVFQIASLRVDVPGRDVTAAGQPVQLTRAEFALLHALILAGGRLVTRSALARVLADGPAHPSARTIDGHVSRLRAKLGAARVLIRTVPGEGYRLARPARRSAAPAPRRRA